MRYAVLVVAALAVLAGCAQLRTVQETASEAERRLDEASIERWCLKARLEPGELLERLSGDEELAALITEACQRRAQAVSAAVRG